MYSWFQPHTHFFMVHGEIFDHFCGADLVMRTLDESLILHLETIGYRRFFGFAEQNQSFKCFAYNLESLEWFNFVFQTYQSLCVGSALNYEATLRLLKKMFNRAHNTVFFIKSPLFIERLGYAHFDELIQWELTLTQTNLIILIQPQPLENERWQTLIQPAKQNLIHISTPYPDEILHLILRIQLNDSSRTLITHGQWTSLSQQAFQLYAQFSQSELFPLKRLSLLYAALRKRLIRLEPNQGLYALKSLTSPEIVKKVEKKIDLFQKKWLKLHQDTIQRLLPSQDRHFIYHTLGIYRQFDLDKLKQFVTRFAQAYYESGLLASKHCVFFLATQLLGSSIEETEQRTRLAIQKAQGGVLCLFKLELLTQEMYGKDVIRELIRMTQRNEKPLHVLGWTQRYTEKTLIQLDSRIFEFFLPQEALVLS